MRIAIGSDHAGFELKQLLLEELRDLGDEVADYGTGHGYRLVPSRMEFWVHHDDRLHDRLAYLRTAEAEGDAWHTEVLQP